MTLLKDKYILQRLDFVSRTIMNLKILVSWKGRDFPAVFLFSCLTKAFLIRWLSSVCLQR